MTKCCKRSIKWCEILNLNLNLKIRDSTNFLVNGYVHMHTPKVSLFGEMPWSGHFWKYNIPGKYGLSENSSYKIKVTIFPDCPLYMNR